MSNRQKVRPEICERTAKARLDAGYREQKDMAKALDVDYGLYNKYETRSKLRNDLIPKFLELTSVRYEWLIAGKGPQYEEEELIKDIRRLGQKETEIVAKMVRGLLGDSSGKS